MEDALRQAVIQAVMRRFAQNSDRREEALRDVLRLMIAHKPDHELDALAALAPRLPESLFTKWAALFADRLLETVPHEQISDLCDGTRENEAALALVFVMFMESERMEAVVARDLQEFC